MLVGTSLLLPVVFAALIALAAFLPPLSKKRMKRGVSIAAPFATVPAIVLSITDPGSEISLPWVLYGISFGVDGVARALILIGALLYSVALITVSWSGSEDATKTSGVLPAFLLVSFAGNIGVYMAADAVSFYLSFSVLSFSAAGLVVHYRSQEAYRATRIYLVMTVISEIAVLAALLFTVEAGGFVLADAPDAISDSPRTGLILTLLIVGFGIKAGTVPLHVWLPLAHPVAPPAASAVLSGAIVKAGMVGFLRFLPLQEDQRTGTETAPILEPVGWTLMALSLIGAFAAVLVGITQKDAKTLLAYSTISQMGFIGVLIAVGVLHSDLADEATDAAVLYAVHHGLAKGALFLGVPIVKHYRRGLVGILVAIGMTGAALAIAGAPVSSGGIAKYVSKEAVGDITVAGMGLEYVLALVATGSTLLLLRLLWIILTEEHVPHRTLDGAFFSWLGLCAAGVAVPWMIGAWWLPLELPDWGDLSTLWDSTWPVLLGLLIGGLTWWAARGGRLPVEQRERELVPPGDLLELGQPMTYQLATRGSNGLDTIHHFTGKARSSTWQRGSDLLDQSRRILRRFEEHISLWPRFGVLVAVVFAIMLLISFVFVIHVLY